MRYKAVFTDAANPSPERPSIVYSATFSQLDLWAEYMLLSAASGSVVRVYEISETPVRAWRREHNVSGKSPICECPLRAVEDKRVDHH